MFKQRSYQKELLDDAMLHDEELHQNLREINAINQWLGGHKVMFDALKKVIHISKDKLERSHFILADLGCGDGHMLRIIADWNKRTNCQMQLHGCDINSLAIEYAKANSSAYPHIVYEKMDVFSDDFAQKRFDIVMMNLFAHHLTDEQIVTLLQQLKKQTRVALIINDLHRHWFAYFGIKCLTRLLPCSRFVRHDAPLSVRRGFRRTELNNLFRQLDFRSYDVHWRWAFRWQVILWM